MGTRVRIVGEGTAPAIDDPIVIEVNDFGPHEIDKNYTFASSGILIRRDSVWQAGPLIINLNGYTLTYGQGNVQQADILTYAGVRSGNVGHAGILCPRSVDQNKEFFQLTPDGYFGFNTVDDLVVQINGPGTIRSGAGAGLAFSDAIQVEGIGRSGDGGGVEISNVNIQVTCLDSMGIRFSNGDIGPNTVFIRRGPVDNRHQSPAAIRTDAGIPPTRVHHNTITESLHVGIFANDNIEVDNNNVTVNAQSETNAFGISGYRRAGGSYHHNTIRATDQGRGIWVDGDNISTNDNDIDVQGASDAFLTHGYQIEAGNNVTARRETVIARAATTNTADALCLKDVDVADVVDVQDSSFTAYGTPENFAVAVQCYAELGRWSDGTASIVKNNTFTSDSYLIGSRYTSQTRNWTFQECTFVLLGGGSRFWLCEQGTADNTGFVLLDCTFTDCNPRDMESGPVFLGDKDWTAEVQWTTTLSGTNNAAYTCVDEQGANQASGNLDGAGLATVQLPEVSLRWDGATKTTDHTERANYTITINGKPQAVTVDKVQTVTEPA